jgi:hypothetical protein
LRTKHYQVAEQVLKRSEADGPLPLRLSVPYAQLLVRTGKAVEGKQKLEATLATERQPHLDVLRAGVALEDARFLRDSYSDAWLLVYGFLTLAEAHNALREFPAGEQAAKIAHYYQPSNPVPVLYRSLAVYGQDKWDQAEVLFVKGKEMYAPAIRKEVDLVRTSFLTQLCSRPAEAPLVCGRFAKQADQAMAPPR